MSNAHLTMLTLSAIPQGTHVTSHFVLELNEKEM